MVAHCEPPGRCEDLALVITRVETEVEPELGTFPLDGRQKTRDNRRFAPDETIIQIECGQDTLERGRAPFETHPFAQDTQDK